MRVGAVVAAAALAGVAAADAEVPVQELFHAVPRDRIGGAAVRRVGEPVGNRVVAYFVRKGHDLPVTE
ncbi:hypothetical protein [Sorangium sp. So ce861]|uniref:hypothetical protein n=1 Tax=Sorangium sp. So ce861 TaxID=3133323 RepID=UPI003F5E9CE0